MAHSGKLRFPASGDGPQSAGGNPAQQQLGVERTSSQLLMTVASRLHERLAHSVSLKLASLEAIDPHKKGSPEFVPTDIPGLASEDHAATGATGDESEHGSLASSGTSVASSTSSTSSAAPSNSPIVNIWRGFPRNAAYYLPLISTLAGMVRKNNVNILLHLMTEWLPQRHVLASGSDRTWELTSAALSSSTSYSTATVSSSSGVSGANNTASGPGTLSASSTSSTSQEPGVQFSPFATNPLTLILGEEDSITERFFSFTSFTGRIPNLKLSDQAQLDLVELVVLQVVADVLSLMLSSLQSTRIGLQTLEKLVQISFALVRSSQPRAIDEETWKVLQAPVQAQWSVVLGYLGPLMMPVFTTFMTLSFSKLPSESQVILLERMHIPLYRADESNVVAFIMASLPHLIGTREKNTAVRLVQLETLDRWLMTCDMQAGGPLFDKINKDVFKKLLESPPKQEELEGPTNRLLATILAHSPASFRDTQVDQILSKNWLKNAWSSKKRDFLECILRVLRGGFLDYHQPSGTVMFPAETAPNSLPTAVIYSPPGLVSTTTIQFYRPGGSLASKLGIKPSVLAQALPDSNPFRINAPSSDRSSVPMSSMFEVTWSRSATLSPYAQCGFIGDREDKMLQRLMNIHNTLFSQKTPLPRLSEQLDICAEIVVQIVAHQIKFGITSVLTPLAHGPIYNKMIALSALKRILDPSSGFLQNAYCFNHAYGSSIESDEGDIKIADDDLKVLQSLLVELVNESLVFTQKQLKDNRKEDALAPFPLQPHAQTCYADLELLHELSSKQQLNTNIPSAVKGCFERVRQLVLLGGPQTWLSRQKEVDQHHLVVADSLNKWMIASNIPLNFNASETVAADDSVVDKSEEQAAATKETKEKKTKETGASPLTATISVPMAAASTASATTAGGPSTKKWPWATKRKAVQPEKFTLVDVAREAIGCLDLALNNIHVLQPGDDLFIGNLLLSNDEEIAQTCSLQLQQAMLTRPNLRPVIVKSLCHMATSLITNSWSLYAPSQPRSFSTANGLLNAEPNNILAILAQVLLFVDLWNLGSLLKVKSSAASTTATPANNADTPPPSLLDELDALALICLGNNVPMIRHTALSLANSLDALRETFGLSNRGVAWSIRQVETPLLQRARFAFLKETAQGVDSRVLIKTDAMGLRIDMAACCHSMGFWSHVLAELCHCLVDSPNTYQSVVASRFLVNQYTANWKNVIANSNALDTLKSQPVHSEFPSLYRNVHIIYFASLSVPLYTTHGLPTTLAMFTKTAGWNPGQQQQQQATTTSTMRFTAPPLKKSMPTIVISSGSTVYPTTSTPPQSMIDDVPTDPAALRHADERLSQVLAQSNNYIASLFKTLSMEDTLLVEATTMAASYVHWRSMLAVTAHAWRWYLSLSSKPGLSKKRLKARPYIASLFRRMMRHQTQFQWAIRCPSPAWIFFVQQEEPRDSASRPTPPNIPPPLPPIYLHLQSNNKIAGLQAAMYEGMLGTQQTTNIEDGPVAPLLLLLPRIIYEFLADMAPNFISEHAKTSTFEAGQYFIDNASMLSRLNSALTDIPMVCARNGALRQYLSPSQNRDAILTILASGTSPALLSIAATGGSSLGSTSSGPKDSLLGGGTISAGSAPHPLQHMTSGEALLGSAGGGAMSAAISGATSPHPSHQRSISVSTSSARDTPPPIHINWAEMTDMLLTWAPVGKACQNRAVQDQLDTTKLLGRVKNATRREERRVHVTYYLGNVSSAALGALNRLAQCGLSVPSSVVDKREVASKVLLDWVLPSDRGHGLRFLRWLLASHLEVLLPVYIDRALGKERALSTADISKDIISASKDSTMFIHAIYDQFLEDAASAPPDDGVTYSTRVFFDRHFQLQKERLRYEKLPLKREDKEFTKVITSQAGPLIFLALLNMTHASSLIRTRSFEMLYRLGPIGFGLSHGLADYDLAKRFQDLRDAFILRMENISRDRALEVSQLVSQTCHMFTEDLFSEAFHRFSTLNSSNRSWTLHFLSCWADHIVMQPLKARAPILSNDRDRTPWKLFSTDSLLHNLYTKLTSTADTTDKNYGRAPLLSLWTNVAKAEGGVNLTAIIEYLLARSVVHKNDQNTVKMIIVELYRALPSAVIKLIVDKLTISSAVQDHKAWSTSNAKTYPLNSTFVTGLGIGTSSFDSIRPTPIAAPAPTAPGTIKITGKGGMIRDQSGLNTSSQSVPAPAKDTPPPFEEVPVPDGNAANAAWATISGKKSVLTKTAPHIVLRDSVVSILADLTIEDLRPILPHLSTVFNYALLNFDSQVSHLLYSALVPLRTLLKESDRKKAVELSRTNGVLDTLITLLKHSAFKMNWFCESTGNNKPQNTTTTTTASSASAPHPTGISSAISQPNLSHLMTNRGGTTNIQALAQQPQIQEGLGPSLLEFAAAIKPGYVVNVMCQCLSLLEEATAKMDWSNELVQWITQSVDAPSTDLAASTKALEICRAVLEASAAAKDSHGMASEPNSPRSDLPRSVSQASTDGQLVYQDEDSEFLRVPSPVVSSIQSAFLETLLFLERDLRTSSHPSWIATATLRDKQRHQENLTLLRARAEDLLALMTRMVPHLENLESLLDFLFVGISVLRLSPISFATFFEKGMVLVQAIVADIRFKDIATLDKKIKRHLKGAASWDFPGLSQLALRGWYSQRTERSSGPLIAALVDSVHPQLISPKLAALQGHEETMPSWVNSILMIAGVLPWLHYSITSLSARKDDEFTNSVTETCISLCSIIEKVCDKETVSGNPHTAEFVASCIMPIRNILSALGNRQANYGGYYDRAGESSRFVQDVLRRLILLENLFNPLAQAMSELLAQLVVEAPAKLTESILFVHEALRSASTPYLSEKPVANLKMIEIRSQPRFTIDAVGSVYKHLFEVDHNPIITEASFRIGGTPANDAQARSSILSIMNALYAYPAGWPMALDYAQLTPDSANRGSTTSDDLNSAAEAVDMRRTSLSSSSIHPLTRSPQVAAKLELMGAGGLKAAIDALRSSIVKAKRPKKKEESPVPSVVVPDGGKTSRKTKGFDIKVNAHKGPASDPTTPGGSIKGNHGGDRSGSALMGRHREGTSGGKEEKGGMVHSASATTFREGSSSSPISGYANIQVHFERVPVHRGTKGGSLSHSSSLRRILDSDEDFDMSEIEDDLKELTQDDFDQFKAALLEDSLSEAANDSTSDSDDSDSDDSDSSEEEGMGDEFFKSLDLAGVNLAAFAANGNGNAEKEPLDDLMAAAADLSVALLSARGENKNKPSLVAKQTPRDSDSSEMSESEDDPSLSLGLGDDFGNFEADSIERALAGLSSFDASGLRVPDDDDDESDTSDDSDSSSGNDSDEDSDSDRAKAKKPGKRSGSVAASASSSALKTKKASTSDNDGESESSGAESNEDLQTRAKKRMSLALPLREKKAFKKSSSPSPIDSPTSMVSPTTASKTKTGTSTVTSKTGTKASTSSTKQTSATSSTNMTTPLTSSGESRTKKRIDTPPDSSSEEDNSIKKPTTPRSKSTALTSSKSGALSPRSATTSSVTTPVPSSSSSGKSTSPTSKHQRAPSAVGSSMSKTGSSSITKSNTTIASTTGASSSSSSTLKSSTKASTSAASSSSSSSSKAPVSVSSGAATVSARRTVFGRGTSLAEVNVTGMRKVLDDPKKSEKFAQWMKANNLDSEVLSLIVHVKEYRALTDSTKRVNTAKKLIDLYFRPKHGLATLSDSIKNDIYESFQALGTKVPPSTFFDAAESYCVDHLTKNHYLMFTKSPYH